MLLYGEHPVESRVKNDRVDLTGQLSRCHSVMGFTHMEMGADGQTHRRRPTYYAELGFNGNRRRMGAAFWLWMIDSCGWDTFIYIWAGNEQEGNA